MNKEPFFEPIFRYFRFRRTLAEIQAQGKIIIDIGCGPKIEFYKALLSSGTRIKEYIGIDPLVSKDLKTKGVSIIKSSFNNRLPIKSNYADYVVAHAVLEHVIKPQKLIAEMIRVTKPGGKVIVTTPTPLAKKLLEILAYNLHLVSKREIREHKNYFDKRKLMILLPNQKNIKIHHQYFEFGMNNSLIINKLSSN